MKNPDTRKDLAWLRQISSFFSSRIILRRHLYARADIRLDEKGRLLQDQENAA